MDRECEAQVRVGAGERHTIETGMAKAAAFEGWRQLVSLQVGHEPSCLLTIATQYRIVPENSSSFGEAADRGRANDAARPSR
jgi:hypothetical protein